MKKLLCTISLVVIAAASCFAQDNTPDNMVVPPQDTAISFSEAVNVNGVSKEELFTRARDWLNLNMASLRIQDKTDGELGARGTVLGQATVRFLGSHTIPATFAFLMTVWVKDGRYMYTVTNVFNTSLNGSPGNGTFGELFTSKVCSVSIPGYSQSKLNEAYQTAKDSFAGIEAGMADSFKAAMTEPSTPNF